MAEKSGTPLNSDRSNYFRLITLVHKGSEFLRRLFITEWNLRNSTTKWEDSDSNREDFIKGLGKNLYHDKKTQKIHKEHLKSRNIVDWDLALLMEAVECFKINVSFEIFKELKSIRNKLHHVGVPEVSSKEYEDYWSQISILLLKLDVTPEEIDKVKSSPIETVNQSPNSLSLDPEVKKLKDSGNKAFKENKFEESIHFYTKAILTPGVPNKDLAVLYSNRSIAFLKLKDIPSAKEDAQGSIHLCPTWWKGYFRLAMAYKANEKYQMALMNLMLAQQFHDNPDDLKELYNQINLCKFLMNKENREEHLDPMYFCSTYEELAEIIPYSTPESLSSSHNFAMKYMGVHGMCIKAQDYYYGRSGQQDYKKAAEWFGKAAAEGSADGMFNLGRMTMEGIGVKCDFNKGIQLLKQTASLPKTIELCEGWRIPNIGVVQAEHSLGMAYEYGTGVPRNYEIAIYWYTRAIKNWSGSSANNVACMYINGTGVPKSADLAFQYWKLGAAKDNVRCMENLTRNYFLLGDFENMQRWYLYAVENGSVALKLELPLKYQEYFEDTITQNFNKEEFTKTLWHEIKNGPLNHLIDLEIKAAYDLLYLKNFRDGKSTERPVSVPAFKIDSSTSEAYRKSITLGHRKIFHDFIIGNNLGSSGNKAKLKQKPLKDLSNLKPIYLEEMKKKNEDHIYEGFILKLTITEDPLDKKYDDTAINSVVHDERGSYERLFIYNYHPTEDDLQKNLGFGSKISIVNPYYRITCDSSPAIRVDNFDSVFVQHELKKVKKCRYCGDENYSGRPVPCPTCKRCYYCSEKCLQLDDSELQHNLICIKPT